MKKKLFKPKQFLIEHLITRRTPPTLGKLVGKQQSYSHFSENDIFNSPAPEPQTESFEQMVQKLPDTSDQETVIINFFVQKLSTM